MVQLLESGISHSNKQLLPFLLCQRNNGKRIKKIYKHWTILTLENESVCCPEAQSSLSLGCTPFWNCEQTARPSCDNHSSILWEGPPARNIAPAGLDSAFEVLLQTDVIKSHSPCGEWEIPKKLEETSENLND